MKNKLLFALGFAALVSSVASACDSSTSTVPLVDPTKAEPWEVDLRSYRPQRLSRGVVLVFPSIAGETVLERRFAQRLCRQGLEAHVLNVVRETNPEEERRDLSIHDASYVRALAGVRAVIAKLDAERTQAPRFAIVGASLGGMLAAHVAGSEERIVASVLIAGAGNVPGVLAHSDQEQVVRQRRARFEEFSLSSAGEYEQLLAPLVPNDPLNVAGNIPAESSYLFIALQDTTVPTRYQQQLRQAIARPVVYTLNSGHVASIVKAYTLHAGKMASFLRRRLGN